MKKEPMGRVWLMFLGGVTIATVAHLLIGFNSWVEGVNVAFISYFIIMLTFWAIKKLKNKGTV